jgi:multicomponent Na+:H+ antiporter subunit F
MPDFFLAVSLIIMANAFICLYRAFAGPTIQDRVLAVNIVSTKTLSVVALAAFIFGETTFLDVTLLYALLNFVVTVALARYLETEGWEVADQW